MMASSLLFVAYKNKYKDRDSISSLEINALGQKKGYEPGKKRGKSRQGRPQRSTAKAQTTYIFMCVRNGGPDKFDSQ